MSLKALSLWQSLHSALACLSSSLKRVLSWSNLASFQSVSVWQSAHFVPSLPLCSSSFLWQAMQVLLRVPVFDSGAVAFTAFRLRDACP